MMTRLPVSATAMFAPVMPISALRNLVRSLPRANFTSLGMSGVWPASTSWLKTSATSSLVMWMAGITMCDGVWSGQLNDPLAQVGLADLDAGLLQVRVEVDLLRRHRLRLDDASSRRSACARSRMYSLTLAGSLVRNTLAPRASALLREALGQFVQVRGGVATLRSAICVAHGFEVDALVGLRAADAVGLGEAAQRAGEIGVVQRGVDGCPEILCASVHRLQLVHENNDQLLRAVHADGQHALDVGGAAGSGDEGDVVGLLGADLG